ncbi:MAG TPA: ATP-binding protein [Nocardioides sp.]|nr:ATP-binding protein [Nocardioides sp.]
MTDIDVTDLLAEAPTPALRLLAEAIDREFARRDPVVPSPYEYAASRLGVDATDLVVLRESPEPPVVHAVGHWLHEARQRWGLDPVGAAPAGPAVTQTVPGAAGDVRAYSSVSVLLPAGTLAGVPVVVRIVPDRFGPDVQLIGRADDSTVLPELLASFLRTCRTESPYQRGSYRVGATSAGLLLERWHGPAASRDLLKLDGSVWHTVDRRVHRVLELADDLAARGLGTSTGLLLVGPPGTGKTQLGTVVAHELTGRATVLVPTTAVTEHCLTDLFDLASDLSPCLILMDDLDLIAGERGETNPHRLREFLNVMDGGLAERSGVVVIASTNDHRKIDKAARRSSRFDTVIKMEAPGLEGRLAILRRYLAWSDADLDLAAVARATDGATGADLKELVRATVLETSDSVTTADLLTQARAGGWREPKPATGQYV